VNSNFLTDGADIWVSDESSQNMALGLHQGRCLFTFATKNDEKVPTGLLFNNEVSGVSGHPAKFNFPRGTHKWSGPRASPRLFLQKSTPLSQQLS
jgi:hypothetical protein